MVPFGNVHHGDDLLDGDGLVRIDGESGVLLALEKSYDLVFGLLVADGLLVAVDVICVCVIPPVLDGDAYRGLGRDLARALRKEELQGVRIHERRGHEEEDEQQEHDVRHGRHRHFRQYLRSSLDSHNR